jgi:ribonuclease HI
MRQFNRPQLTPDQVLATFRKGPTTGLFTDGSATPNPGPGGWSAVYVVDDEIIDSLSGGSPHTTNNRMELTGLVAAYRMASPTMPLDVFTDSQLCVKTINECAASWARRGWRRKDGEIKNLELVQELYALSLEKKNLKLQWIRAHDGSRWNEYADALAGAYAR